MDDLTVERVRSALQSSPLPGLPAHQRISPPGRRLSPPPGGPPPRQAGVLLLLYPKARTLHFVLTRRTERLGVHSGQISLPGGQAEPRDETFTATALREAREELGIALDQAEVLGELTELYIPPSNFIVHPIVAYIAAALKFNPQADEVAEVIEIPLSALLDPRAHPAELCTVLGADGAPLQVPAYRFNTHVVWGATAMVLSEFEEVLRRAL